MFYRLNYKSVDTQVGVEPTIARLQLVAFPLGYWVVFPILDSNEAEDTESKSAALPAKLIGSGWGTGIPTRDKCSQSIRVSATLCPNRAVGELRSRVFAIPKRCIADYTTTAWLQSEVLPLVIQAYETRCALYISAM